MAHFLEGGEFFAYICVVSNINFGSMKRLLFAAIAIILGSTAANAQNKGDKYFGGTAGITIQAGSGGVGAGFAIQPEFGGFIADKCRLGLSVGYAISGGTHSLTACPNFAYYVRLCDGMYYTPCLEAGFAMALVGGGAYPGLGVGLHMFSLEFRPTKHFGLTANLATLNFIALASSGSAFTFNLGVNPTIGIKYYF